MGALTSEQKASVRGLFKIMPKRTEFFMNDKGEFFTNINYAENSTNNKEAIVRITPADVQEEAPAKEPKTSKPKTSKPKENESENTNPEKTEP